MYVFLLGFLFVIVIPLAEGALLALLLREVHLRHPLPLGGVIDTPQRRHLRESRRAAEQAREKAEAQEKRNGSPVPPSKPQNDEPAESLAEEIVSPSVEPEVNVFDEAAHVPEDLPVNEALDPLGEESTPGIPNDFEDRIETSARTESDIPSGVRGLNDEMDADDLDALAAALPREKIDFTQELDMDSGVGQPITASAKEVLGENFDYEILETEPIELPVQQEILNESIENSIDIQEDGAGTVQVTSLFLPNISPQLSNFIEPQTIVPTFSNGWIQETAITDASLEGNAEQFCFTAESTPMFVRKRKSS